MTGQRSNQLNYVPAGENTYKWWAVQGSNLRPPACKAGALTNRANRPLQFIVQEGARSVNALPRRINILLPLSAVLPLLPFPKLFGFLDFSLGILNFSHSLAKVSE